MVEKRTESWPAWARLIILGVPLFGTYILLQIGIGAYAHMFAKPWRLLAVIGAYAVGAIVMGVAYHWLVTRIEKRAATELDRRFSDAAPGFAAGSILFGATQGVTMLLGASQITGLNGVTPALWSFFAAAFAAVGEEIIFRSVVFRLLDEWAGTITAVCLSSAIFGGLHLLNGGATVIGAIAIAAEAGVLLCLAYKFSGSLWLPIGIHLGWNFCEGGVFGASVSGTSPHGLLTVSYSGPDLFTGGSFGLEASAQAMIICLVASGALAVGVAKRHRTVST